MALLLPIEISRKMRQHYQAANNQPKVVAEEVRHTLDGVISDMADLFEERYALAQFNRARFVAACHGQGDM